MKKEFRTRWILLLIFMLAISVGGCKKQNVGNNNQGENDVAAKKVELSYDGELAFTGLENEFKVLYNDIYAMKSITTEVKHISSSGEESVNTVTGVVLDTILSERGISQKDFSSIRLIAGDGYAMDVPSEILKDKEIILAYKFDDEYLEEKKQPLRIAINDVRSMYFVSNLAEIRFIKENKNDNDVASDIEGEKKVIILETATNSLESDIYTYYESEDQAIKVADLFNKYVTQKVNNVKFAASDGFEKSEDFDVLMEGYIKTTGKDSPLFTSPDLPKGMNVKKILTLNTGDITFGSAAQAIEVLEQRTIDEKTGVALDAFIGQVALEGDYYVFTAADGYSAEVSKSSLEKGIIHLNNSGQYKVKFDESLPKSTGIKDILTIEIGDGTNALDGEEKEESENTSSNNDKQEALWTITVEGLSDGNFDFTSDRAERKLERVQLHTERTKNDEKKPEDWEGFKVLDVLSFLKVEDFNSLVIVANDGYEIELSKEQIDDESILAIFKDGELLSKEDNLVQFVQNTEFSNTWVKGVSKIILK